MTRELFKRKSFWLTVTPLLVVVIVVVTMLTSPPDPPYHGRPLSYWIDQLPSTVVAPNGNAATADVRTDAANFGQILTQQIPGVAEEATNAIQDLGEKCLPYLMSRLRAQDPAWKMKCSAWAMTLGLKNIRWRQNNFVTAGQAAIALEILGGRAQSVLPQLLKLTNNKDPYIRALARHVLEEIKTAQAKKDSA